MLPIVDVPIDERAVIPCPELGFKPRRASRACASCEQFHGIAMMTEAEEVDVKDRAGNVIGKRPILWHEKYVIRCAYPIERRTQILEVVEA